MLGGRGGGGGLLVARIPDLRIPSATSAVHASTAYKYDALTDCATILHAKSCDDLYFY